MKQPPNIYEIRYQKLLKLIRINQMLKRAKIVYPEKKNG